MDLLVSDTSVLIDLERGLLIRACFDLPYRFCVPDVLYERELKDYGGKELVRFGLEVVESDEVVSQTALGYRRTKSSLSAPDTFSLALASTNGWCLLAGDGDLRKMAHSLGVNCHGVLWVIDELHGKAICEPQMLLDGLTAISNHTRCRLPRAEVRQRLKSYTKEMIIVSDT